MAAPHTAYLHEFRKVLFGPRQPPPDLGRSEPVDEWAEMSTYADHPSLRYRMHLGMTSAGWMLTEDRRNLLILGPPRSNKTSGSLIPIVLFAPGPVVSASTKPDVYRATAQSRARMGRLWHVNLDHDEPLLPGTTHLRWSPIPPAASWSTAMVLGSSMAAAAEVGEGTSGSNYFRLKSGELTASLLHAAALGNKDMHWMLRAVGGHEPTLDRAVEILDEAARTGTDATAMTSARSAFDALEAIRLLDARSRSSIFSTTANAFAAYRHPSAMAMSQDPNFDPAAFAAGFPDVNNPRRFTEWDWPLAEGGGRKTGWADTIYITASKDVQSLVAPIVVGVLTAIRSAVFRQHAQDEAADYYNRRPMIWALDELKSIAPMADLPSTLSQSAGQGLLIAACLQDLDQAEEVWKNESESFLTLFGNILIYKGLRNQRTLRAISDSTGKQWITRRSSSTSMGGTSNSTSQSMNDQLIPTLDPGDISLMRSGPSDKSNDPRRVLALLSSGPLFMSCTPYYSSFPIAQALVASLEWVADRSSPADVHRDLRVPVLDQGNDLTALRAAGGEPLVRRYVSARRRLEAKREERRRWMAWAEQQPWFSKWEQGPYDHALFCRDFIIGAPEGTGLDDFVPDPLRPAQPASIILGNREHEVFPGSVWRCDDEPYRMIVGWLPLPEMNDLAVGFDPWGAAVAGRAMDEGLIVRCFSQVAVAVAEHMVETISHRCSTLIWDSAGPVRQPSTPEDLEAVGNVT